MGEKNFIFDIFQTPEKLYTSILFSHVIEKNCDFFFHYRYLFAPPETPCLDPLLVVINLNDRLYQWVKVRFHLLINIIEGGMSEDFYSPRRIESVFLRPDSNIVFKGIGNTKIG